MEKGSSDVYSVGVIVLPLSVLRILAWTKMKISELKGSFSESVRGSAHFNEQEVLISGGRKAKKHTHTHSRAEPQVGNILHTGRGAEFHP